MNFGSHTDSVVLSAAALVNVLTPGRSRGREFRPADGAELVTAITAALREGSSSAHASAREVAAYRSLAVAARPVFELVGGGDLNAAAVHANALLERYRPTPSLSRHDGEPWHLHFHGGASRDPSGWGGGVAVALATVLGGEYADRLGVCEADACDRVFVDVSRNGTRRFCSLACQNRTKAATHRARRRE